VALTLQSLTGCFLKRPDFMVGVDDATVPLVDAGRTEIVARVTELEQSVSSGSFKGDRLKEANAELASLRNRLQDGDFRVGDQLIVTVTRDQVQVDTATVREGKMVAFAALPDISVNGLLRSEIQSKLQEHVNRFLVDHSVRVNFVTRLQMMGAIARPGFYSISPDRPVSEVIMLAGGPTATSNLEEVTIRRNGRLIVKAKMWRDAVKTGTTVAQLGLQPGDVIEIGERKRANWFQIIQIAAFASTAVFGVIRLLQFIYAEPE
jgi:protein involved in polysaccharide export with SLBB domain